MLRSYFKTFEWRSDKAKTAEKALFIGANEYSSCPSGIKAIFNAVSSFLRIYKTASRVASAVLILCLLALGACQPAPRPTVFLTIGDSIGNGHGIATPWPELIRARTGNQLINHSVSDRQTDWGVGQIDRLLDEHKPSHVLILLGANDAVHSDSLTQSATNLQAMVDKARAKGATVFVSTLIPITYAEEYHQRVREMNRLIGEIQGAIIVDSYMNFTQPEQWLADGLHPNQGGQRAIAEAFLEKLAAQ